MKLVDDCRQVPTMRFLRFRLLWPWVIALGILLVAGLSILSVRKTGLTLLESSGEGMSSILREAIAGNVAANEALARLQGRTLAEKAILASRSADNPTDRSLLLPAGITRCLILSPGAEPPSSPADTTVPESLLVTVLTDLFRSPEGFPRSTVAGSGVEWNGLSRWVAAAAQAGRHKPLVALIEERPEDSPSTGIGTLINRIAGDPSVAYICLQSPEGILVATPNLRRMTRIERDAFLEECLTSGQTASRLTTFGPQAVLEVVSPHPVADDDWILLRIGLSLESYRSLVDRYTWFVAIGSAGMLFLLLGTLLLLRRAEKNQQAQAEVRTRLGFLLQTLDGIQQGVLVLDPDGTLQYLNSRTRDWLKLEAVTLPARYATLFPTDPFEVGSTLIERTTRHGSTRLTTPARTLELRWSTAPLTDPGGSFAGLWVRLEDVTDEREEERVSHRKEHLAGLTTLAAGLAHEIRNPLNAISLSAQRLTAETNLADDPEMAECLRVIKHEVSGLNGKITDFLALVRQHRSSSVGTDLSEVMHDLARREGPLFEAESQVLRITPGPPVQLPLTHEAVETILGNLLRNARENTRRPGAVTSLGWEIQDSGMVVISISDEGIGIAPENLERIFDPYFTTRATGTGLGLSLVQRTVEEAGGTVRVESSPAGTFFRVTLPF